MNAAQTTEEFDPPAVEHARPTRLLALLTDREAAIKRELNSFGAHHVEVQISGDPSAARTALVQRRFDAMVAHESFLPLLIGVARHATLPPTILVTPSKSKTNRTEAWIYQSVATTQANRGILGQLIPAAVNYGRILAERNPRLPAIPSRAEGERSGFGMRFNPPFTPSPIEGESVSALHRRRAENRWRVILPGFDTGTFTDRSSELLDAVLGHARAFTGRIDRNGRISEVRGPLPAQFGVDAQAAIGRLLEDIVPDCSAQVDHALGGGEACISRRLQASGRSVPVSLRICAEGEGDGAIFVVRDMTERRQLEEQLASGVDAERREIGMEIHDGLGQLVTGMTCLASALADRLAERDPDAAAEAQSIADIAKQVLDHARALSHGLNGIRDTEMELLPALEEHCACVRNLHGVDCAVRVSDSWPQLDAERSHHVLRIVQEAVCNAIRHGQAKKIRVLLRLDDNLHRLEIRDDGVGMDPARLKNRPGIGLSSMRCRCNLLDGGVRIASRHGAGTRVICTFP